MINLMDYNRYKEARLSGDSNMLDAMETDNPNTCGIYEQIFNHEKLQEYIRELDKQRAEEKRYQRWIADHGYDVREGKMSDECFKASFTLSGTLDFYERYKKEIAEGRD